MAMRLRILRSGSSPRVRGRPADEAALPRHLGLIPACAGQTCASLIPYERIRAHPRVCGADTRRASRFVTVWGSSPRVRGRPAPSTSHHASTRLIPACAGQTATSHTCCASFHGSSPRVRGRLTRVVALPVREGLIPACAGQTTSTSSSMTARRAHPRVCGADHVNTPNRKTAVGSSPRVRGRRQPTQPPPTRTWAHPRMCGADRLPGANAGEPDGSSPRVRGRRRYPVGRVMVSGLIPACAGQTVLTETSGSPPAAHPRVCGADHSAVALVSNMGGSSPRVRGRPTTVVSRPSILGLIPACAGQTRQCRAPRHRSSAHPRVCGADPVRTE